MKWKNLSARKYGVFQPFYNKKRVIRLPQQMNDFLKCSKIWSKNYTSHYNIMYFSAFTVKNDVLFFSFFNDFSTWKTDLKMNFYCKIHTIIVLIFIHNLFTKVQFYATTIVVMRRSLNYRISVSHTGCLYKFVRTKKMIQS